MTPRIALDLALDGVSVLSRVPDDHPDAGKWWLEGRVSLDQPNMPAALAKLRDKAETRSGADQTTLLILPDSQLLYTSLERDDRRPEETIRSQLKGRTPYEVSDLTFDYLLRGDRLQVAVVALETLLEAEAFAIEFGFRPVAVVAKPDDPAYPAIPSFGPTGLAKELLGGQKLDLRVENGFTVIPGPAAPQPAPILKGDRPVAPDPGPTVPVFSSPRRAATIEATEASATNPEQTPNPKPAPPTVPELRAEKVPDIPPKPTPVVEPPMAATPKPPPVVDPPVAAPSKPAAPVAPPVASTPKPKAPVEPPLAGPTKPTPPVEPPVVAAPKDAPEQPVKVPVAAPAPGTTFESGRRRAPLTAEARQASVDRLAKIAPRITTGAAPVLPAQAKPVAPVELDAPKTQSPTPLAAANDGEMATPPSGDSPDKPAAPAEPRLIAEDLPPPPPLSMAPGLVGKLEALKTTERKARPLDQPSPTPLGEAQALALPGYGRERAAARGGGRLGLYMTVGLIGVLALVGAGAALLDPLSSDDQEVAEAPPAEEAADPSATPSELGASAPELDLVDAPVVIAGTPDGDVTSGVAVAGDLDSQILPEQTPILVAASDPDAPPSAEMTIPAEPRLYFEAEGWFERPADLFLTAAEPSQNDIVLAALDPSLSLGSAGAAPARPAEAAAYTRQTTPAEPQPAPIFDENGLVIATAEGIVAPGGYGVFLGRPDVFPAARPADLVPVPEPDLAPTLDENGLVVASAEGVVAPGGYRVVLGRPAIAPVPRSDVAAPAVTPPVVTADPEDAATIALAALRALGLDPSIEDDTSEAVASASLAEEVVEGAEDVAEAANTPTDAPLTDESGLVVARAEGVVAPGGYSVVLGRPAVLPVPRATNATPDAAEAEATDPAAAVPREQDTTDAAADALVALLPDASPQAETEEDTLVVATAEGALAPGGYRVVLGRPSVLPIQRASDQDTDVAAVAPDPASDVGEETDPEVPVDQADLSEAPETETALAALLPGVAPQAEPEARDLVVATADGTVAPGGYRVVLGRPSLLPIPRATDAAPDAVVAVDPAQIPADTADDASQETPPALASLLPDPSAEAEPGALVVATAEGSVAPGGYRVVLGRPAVLPLRRAPGTDPTGPPTAEPDEGGPVAPTNLALNQAPPATSALDQALTALANGTDDTEVTLVAATTEGALAPGGYTVVLGRPAIMPVPRTGIDDTPADQAQAQITPDDTADPAVAPVLDQSEIEARQVLRRIRPLQRPDRDPAPTGEPEAQAEPEAPPSPLARTRPQQRPTRSADTTEADDAAALAAQQAAAASLAQQEAEAAANAAATAISQIVQGTPEDPAEIEAPAAPVSDLALAQSDRPRTRPRRVERAAARIVTQRQREATASASTAAASASTAREVDRGRQTIRDSGGSVARAATERNVLRLNQINLIGVYGRPSARRALVRLANGRYVKVEVGDRLDRGRVTAIGEGELSYQRGGRNVVLRMPRA